MTIFFWILIFLVTYTYFGYPLILVIVAKFKKNGTAKAEIYPSVSIIIAAHNEEKDIKNKLDNALSLDYPKEKLEIIVASDNSEDRTNEIVRNYNDSHLKLIAFSEHKGKTYVQNEAAREANGEIILFSDATTSYESQLIKKIVKNFVDPNVGAVGGELIFVNKTKSSIGNGTGLYWKYEKFLKNKESRISSLIGVSGCCYAVRKNLYEPISPDLISDFVIAQLIYKKGKKVVYEPEAISYENTCDNPTEEFRMRVRIAIRTLYGVWKMKELLNPFKYGFFTVQLISHKILRYLIPPILIFLFLLNIVLVTLNPELVYKFIFCLQIVFYVTAVFSRGMPYYFCLTNLALLIGFWKFLLGEKKVLWSPSRKE